MQTTLISVAAQASRPAPSVVWSLGGACLPNCGTIQAAGTNDITYTAPATLSAGSVVVQAASAAGGVAPATLTISLLPALAAAGANLPANLTVGSPATGGFSAGGGLLPYGWAIVSGTLPNGLVLNSGTGTLSGTPLSTGSFQFQVQTMDAAPIPGRLLQTYTLNVQAATPAAPPTAPPAAQVTARAAARLLEQSSFGPTAEAIAHVQAIGMRAYLDEQMSMAPTFLPSLGLGVATDPAPDPSCQYYPVCGGGNWWKNALFAPDQLRQRVAFALSEILVVSDHGVDARAMPLYYNTLLRTAFGSYRDVMGAISTNPGMGVFLSMIGNTSTMSSQANENYARELMQLFSLGTTELNEDGTEVLDSNGQAVPVYTQDQVRAFARAYTGWMWARPDGSASGGYLPEVNYAFPLVPVESMHESTPKTLLNGTTLPAGQTVTQDLNGALTNVFEHSNLPPFVATKLIQHLVTGNPSPAYVQRIVAVMKDNGHAQRGDLRAVLTAILMDPEARAGDLAPLPGEGHLKQPLLWQAGILRGLGAAPSTPNAYTALDNLSTVLGQHIMSPPSVFGFFSPNSVLPGTTTTSPEFGLNNTALITAKLNVADQLINLGANGIIIDLRSSGTLVPAMQKDPGACLDQLATTLLHSAMPADVRQAILTQLGSLAAPTDKLRLAVYLVVTSNQFGSFD